MGATSASTRTPLWPRSAGRSPLARLRPTPPPRDAESRRGARPAPMRLPAPHSPWRVPALLALFVGVSLLTRWLSLSVELLDMDEAAHAVGSWVLRDGGLLYRDFVDNKPPLLYVYYALA